MESEQHLVNKNSISDVYFLLGKESVSTLDFINFIKSLGLKVDQTYSNYYIVVDKKKWAIARLKYGV